MAVNFDTPISTDDYLQLLANIKDMQAALAKFLDGVTATGLPTGAKRWNSANSRFEYFNGTAWVEIAPKLAHSISGKADTAALADVATLSEAANAAQAGSALATQLSNLVTKAGAEQPGVNKLFRGDPYTTGQGGYNVQASWGTAGSGSDNHWVLGGYDASNAYHKPVYVGRSGEALRLVNGLPWSEVTGKPNIWGSALQPAYSLGTGIDYGGSWVNSLGYTAAVMVAIRIESSNKTDQFPSASLEIYDSTGALCGTGFRVHLPSVVLPPGVNCYFNATVIVPAGGRVTLASSSPWKLGYLAMYISALRL